MTDRELLEWAAKAAGLDLQTKPMFGGDAEPGYYRDGEERPEWVWWDPLADDGDALRLAVKLRIDPMHETKRGASYVYAYGPGQRPSAAPEEPHGSDPYAATRRAIVRAAAEIGRASTGEKP